MVQIEDKADMPNLVGPLQAALSSKVAGARIEVKQLQTNPVEQPIQILLSNQADVASDQEVENLRPRSKTSSVQFPQPPEFITIGRKRALR